MRVSASDVQLILFCFTEAHPIDPGALHCCSGERQVDVQEVMSSLECGSLRGDPLSVGRKSLQVDHNETGK